MPVKGKRLIFTVTTGRSGTMYLASILRLLRDVDVFHEPENLFNEYFRKIRTDKNLARHFWQKEKFARINDCKNDIYIETSHFFCKGFFEPLIETGVVPDLIILKRSHRSVAKSLFRLNTIPGRTIDGIENYLSPDDEDVLHLPDWQKYTDYQLCYWYCLEIERRQKAYSEILSNLGGKVVEVSFEKLIKINKALPYLQKALQLPPLSGIGTLKYLYKNLRPQKLNTKVELSKNLKIEDDRLTEQEAEILKDIIIEKGTESTYNVA